MELEAWGPGPPPQINTQVTYAYDNVGNRTSMTDDLGMTEYEYTELSQMKSETRAFNDLLPEAPLSGNRFKLEYSYDLAGGLRSLKDPYGEQINYGYDESGKLKSVTGSAFAGTTTYAANAEYRAWGALKSLSYGNAVTMSSTFNNRLLPDHYELEHGTTEIMKENYQYHDDGSLKYLQDQLNDRFDRLNIYDQVGRIKEAKTGIEARGGTVTDPTINLPYRQSFQFNEFENMTQRNNLHWGIDTWEGRSNNLSYTYQNNRVTNQNWQYDADGRVLQSMSPDEPSTSSYDARGLLIDVKINNIYDHVQRFYNGDGREIKRTKMIFTDDPNMPEWPNGTFSGEDPIYYIRSSVLGGEVVSETYAKGKKKKTFVIAAGAKIATQTEYSNFESVYFEHYDASGMSYRSTQINGTVAYGDGSFDGAPAEFDPMGGNVGTSTPYIEIVPPLPPPTPDFPYFPIDGYSPMYVNGQAVRCSMDGMGIPCSQVMNRLENGSAIPEALAGYQHLHGFQFNSHGLGLFSVRVPVQVGWHVNPNQSVTPIYSQHSFRTYTLSVPVTNISWAPQTQEPEQQPQSNQALVDQAIADAREILSKDNECSRYFGLSQPIYERVAPRTDEIVDYTERLNVTPVVDALGTQLRNNIGFLRGDPNNRTTGIRMNSSPSGGVNVQNGNLRYRTFEFATVNIRGPFLSTGSFGNYNGAAGRTLAILHEIAHMIQTGVTRNSAGRVTGNTYLIPDDGVAPNQSVTNTETVEQKCKKELDALSGP